MFGTSRLVFSENRFLITLFAFLCEEKKKGRVGDNYLESKNILFIHNPKVAGNSLLKLLFEDIEKLNTSHKTPSFLVTTKTWETSITIVAIRHPLDRLISSYNYHTNVTYDGVFLKKHPQLHQFSLEQYFDVFSKVPYVIMPQWYYTKHFLSNKPVNFLLRFENLKADVGNMLKSLGISSEGLPHLNSTRRESCQYFDSESFRKKVSNYYKKDFVTFGYEANFEDY